MTRKPAATEDKPLSRRVLVNVRRDSQTATPRVVWRHEVPILEAIFGEGNVPEVDPETLDEGYSAKPSPELLVHNKRQDAIRKPSQCASIGHVFIGDARNEYERLTACYGKHPDVNESMTEHVYGRFQGGFFQRIVGTPTLDDLPDDQLRQLLIAYGYTLPEASYDSGDDERKEAAAARVAFDKLEHGALVKLCNETGVEVG